MTTGADGKRAGSLVRGQAVTPMTSATVSSLQTLAVVATITDFTSSKTKKREHAEGQGALRATPPDFLSTNHLRHSTLIFLSFSLKQPSPLDRNLVSLKALSPP